MSIFAPTTAAPDRSYRMDHVTDAVPGEEAGPCDHGAPRGAASVSLAQLGHELWARSQMDRAVHATTACQFAVRGVDEGVGGEAGDVSTSELKARDTAIGTNDLERSRGGHEWSLSKPLPPSDQPAQEERPWGRFLLQTSHSPRYGSARIRPGRLDSSRSKSWTRASTLSHEQLGRAPMAVVTNDH